MVDTPDTAPQEHVILRRPDYDICISEFGTAVKFASPDTPEIEQARIRLAGVKTTLIEIDFHLQLLLNLRPRDGVFRKIFPFLRHSSNRSTDPLGLNSEAGQLYRPSVAQALDHVISSKHGAGSAAMLSQIRDLLVAHLQNRRRMWYIVINIIIVTIILAAAGYFYRAADAYANGFGNLEAMGLALTMGSVGALFSSASNLRNVEMDVTSSLLDVIIHSGQRILIGILGAAILYIGVRSGLLSGILNPEGATLPDEAVPLVPSRYWVAFVAILAGFSERLVPNLLASKSDSAITKPSDPTH